MSTTAATTLAHRITSEAEALDLAADLAAQFTSRGAEIDESGTLPADVVDAFSASGLWAITVPQEFGGLGASTATLVEVIARISSADPSLGQIPQNHFCLIEDVLLSGTREQQEFFFSLALEGARFANAFSEAGGKTAAEVQTRIMRDGNDYVVNGRKFYATGTQYAHWIPVLAVDPDGKELLAFAPRDAQGLHVVGDWDAFGQRATASGSVVLTDLRVPANRVFPMYREYENPTVAGPLAQITTAAIDLGIARGAFAATLEAVRSSRPWVDANIDSATQDPLTLNELGRLDIDINAADALIQRAAHVLDAAKDEPTETSVAAASVAVARAKVLTTEVALAAGSKLNELGGTRSVVGGRRLDRFWRNARVHTLHDPVRWKFNLIGNYVLNGVFPNRHSWN
ncbi:SfnB family sulfur acquisition oxidoreductase [Paeniglutamicibacter cryotolerans]|uniref:Dibenzothiophene monooxygenase n=1 Tax=Paeniglutamicibacter cryotolerans TaxID=670079 RepID=A0A839QM68_9MICC|nr:SfnB family sulfur acquisition oxidoreductase [Paeniglutamicibacter cryotolerans]MBB2995705.1 SfnB family sulfur acquisition oxidoreductase [Paeniglutamicibacter cryotolerans]